MRKILLILLIISNINSHAQHNMLGKTQDFIMNYYNLDPEYTVKVDTISRSSIVITCKSSQAYPFYTYELDRINDVCISYGFVSKNREILETYIDILEHLGQLIEKDSSSTNYTYKVASKNKIVYYSIKQPFVNTQMVSRRNLFYILVTEEKIGLKSNK